MGLNKAIAGYSEAELIQTIQNNLNQCQTLIMKRSQTSKDMGFNCYYMFNVNYTQGLQQILGTDALNTQLKGISDGNQRLKGVRALAEITNHMLCDEIGFRNNHRNDSVECLLYEKLGIGTEVVLEFQGLDAMMIGWQLEENIKNPIVGKVVGDIENLYKQLFAGSQECVQSLRGNEYCRNVKASPSPACGAFANNDLPEDPHQLLDRSENWVVIKDAANAPQAGDGLAFKITGSGEVQMTNNREPVQTLMHVDSTQQMWLFFDLNGSTPKPIVLGTCDNKTPENVGNCAQVMDSRNSQQTSRPITTQNNGLTVRLAPNSSSSPKLNNTNSNSEPLNAMGNE
ncbi:unnamed protein product [Medioppia subpectinata]|uniref:NHR domain-containing protein n=1 Tax=Medioppia subpectinata TaxID=1979941 RepID=A0A7R9Q8A2_9ACAR|nr:unnamed protein product [Medioppia subpectinata]CAG2115142.1 unnamed protein product [Medioppia subpectinata]